MEHEEVYTKKLLLEKNTDSSVDVVEKSIILKIDFGNTSKSFVLNRVPYITKYLHGGSKSLSK